MKINLEQIEEKITAFILFVLIVLVFLAALLRWWGVPVSWAVDMASLLFVWVCFIGADLAMNANKHMAVDLFLNTLPQKVRLAIIIAMYLLMSAFLVIVVIWFGFKLVLENASRQMNTLPISFSWATVSAPVGSVLMMWTIIKKMYRSIKLIRGKSYEKAETELRESTERINLER
jgi:TRAP-type C4-dicarboxylate transport system permease small subunit